MIMRSPNRAVRSLTTAAFVVSALVTPVLATQAAAQLSMPQPPPQIVVSGRGEVQVAPDRAQVQVGMETQAKTAALASQENSRKQAAILAGGQIAELLELNINEYERPQPRAMMAMAKMEMADAAAPTPVNEGMATVAVSVTTRWRFMK